MPFTLHVSQTFANQGIVTQASDGLHMTPRPSAVPPAPLSAPQAYAGLFMPPRSSAAPSLTLLAFSASLAAPQFSAASGGAPLASAHSTVSFVPARPPPGSAVLRVSILCWMVLNWPSVPIIEPCLIISCSVYN